ncbi:MAG: sulfotransferase domain-containing protein [Kiritimatiellae bacterium]|nr:sulfotransferase domain-containing protein [Kiritimatiellia bacterium]
MKFRLPFVEIGIHRRSPKPAAKEPPELRRAALIARYVSEGQNPFLVSFPRTGSHWLRAIAEAYVERPQLKLTFFHPGREDFFLYHTHDLDLDVVCESVIYLYRNPVETIYSQMRYEGPVQRETEWVVYWTRLYGLHLRKWLHEERFTTRKTVIRYENLRANLPGEFRKISEHFNMPFDPKKLKACAERCTRDVISAKAGHDARVINKDPAYPEERGAFAERFGNLIWDTLFDVCDAVRPLFDDRPGREQDS